MTNMDFKSISVTDTLPPKNDGGRRKHHLNFREIFRFEARYQLRQVSSWLLLTAFFLFGFLMLRMVTLADETYLNAPATIAFFTVFASVIWVVIGGVVAGDLATRDVQTRMHPLTYTAPVSKTTYLGARFLAALALNALMMASLYAGLLLSYYGPGAKTAFIGPFRAASYLTNYGFLALPTVIVTTALQFTFAALSRRAIASYIASIIIIIFSQFGGTTVRFMLEWKLVGSLMDLLGTSIIADMEGWTPIDKNTRLVHLQGTWLWNRVVWIGIAAAALVFTYFRFRLAHVTPDGRWLGVFGRRNGTLAPRLKISRNGFDDVKYDASRTNIPDVVRSFGFVTNLRQAITIAAMSFSSIAKSWTGLTLVAALAVGTGLFATEYMEWLGVPLLARTEEVLRILAPPLNSITTQWIIIPLLTIFFAGELLWREREAGVHELSDPAPLRESVMLLGKFLGLALIIITWLAFLLMAGIINQLVMDYRHFEIGVYIKALFGIQLANYLLFAVLVFAIHVLVNQKYIAHMVAFCAYGFIIYASTLGVEHNMLIYAADPGWSYSDMRGFEPFMRPWLAFKLYWASWALLIALVATVFWVRSKEVGVAARLHLARGRFSKLKTVAMIAVGLVLVSGGFVFYNTNVLNQYSNKADVMAMRAAYERRYGQFERSIQPVPVRAKLHVDIYPEHRSAQITCSYQLVNRSNKAIDSIHLSTIPQLPVKALSFDRAATAVVVDDELGYRMYSLKHRLEPGDSLQMNFRVNLHPRGFSNHGVDASIATNGSHIRNNDWMPVMGYDDNRQLRNPRDREKYGLPAKPERPSLYDVEARYDARHAAQIAFEAVVGTSKDQIAVAPGDIIASWDKGNRRYFHYVTDAPIHNEYAFFSARYAVREAEWTPDSSSLQHAAIGPVKQPASTPKPVRIQVYYHPQHDANIERMVKSAYASLEYYSAAFGPYPYSDFRVLERPGAGRGMHAAPMTIDYEEGYSLMNPKPGGLDLPYHIMAHEVAHQWWGLNLTPAAVEGAGLLVESFATYSAMQVVEETLGYEHLLKYLSQMRQEYEVPRSRAAPPLLRSNNSFMNYRKGPFALFALRNYIGKEKVNDALRRMLRKHIPGSPLATSLDFYRELESVTPDSLQYMVHDLFAANTFWELETKQATAKKTEKGNWQVTLEVDARKVTVDSIGNETNVPMNDWIEVGVYSTREKGESSAKALYLRKHQIASGKQTINIVVAEKPGRAGIDPNNLLIDLEMGDNTKAVKTNDDL
jgi:ABC-2 type transport system permease protein